MIMEEDIFSLAADYYAAVIGKPVSVIYYGIAVAEIYNHGWLGSASLFTPPEKYQLAVCGKRVIIVIVRKCVNRIFVLAVLFTYA